MSSVSPRVRRDFEFSSDCTIKKALSPRKCATRVVLEFGHPEHEINVYGIQSHIRSSLVQLDHRGTSQGCARKKTAYSTYVPGRRLLCCAQAVNRSNTNGSLAFDLASERQRDLCICTLGAEGGQSPVRRLLFTPINYPSLDLPLLRRQEEKNSNCGRTVFPRSVTCRDQQIGAFLVSNVLADVCIDLQNLFDKNKNQSSSSSLSSSAAPGAPRRWRKSPSKNRTPPHPGRPPPPSPGTMTPALSPSRPSSCPLSSPS